MKRLALAGLLLAGCTEHGQTPDGGFPDVRTIFPQQEADIVHFLTTSPGDQTATEGALASLPLGTLSDVTSDGGISCPTLGTPR